MIDEHLAPRTLVLPRRAGPRPLVTGCAPQVQLDQFPTSTLRPELLERAASLPDVDFGPSRRAPPGTVGMHLRGTRCDDCAFMIDREFAHVHPGDDSSLHLLLPEPLRSEAIAAGWAEPHPLAGEPTVPAGIVFVYAPRTTAELDVVARLIHASWRNANEVSPD